MVGEKAVSVLRCFCSSEGKFVFQRCRNVMEMTEGSSPATTTSGHREAHDCTTFHQHIGRPGCVKGEL